MNILIIHGPNFHLLGKVSATTGTRLTLSKIDRLLRKLAGSPGHTLKIYHCFSEAKICRMISTQRKWAHGVLISPGLLAMNSYVLKELLAIVRIPAVEIHLAEFPGQGDIIKNSVLGDVVSDQIVESGENAYTRGFNRLLEIIGNAD